jgi:hypothetical protein
MALPVKFPSIAAIAPPVAMIVPSLIVIPLSISIDIDIPLSMATDVIADCISAFIEEAFDSMAPELVAAGVGAGESSQAIVTGAREADIMGTMDVMEAEGVVWARAVEKRAAKAMVVVEARIFMVVMLLKNIM